MVKKDPIHDKARIQLAEKVAASGVRHRQVLEAIATVPRHAFVDEALDTRAYEDSALPIGHQQTISKPSVVARMVELLHKPKKELGKVLEIGTGCGYQAAILSLVAAEVYSIERIRPLHDQARAKLRPFRIPNLRLVYGDGIRGLPQAAPFDGIILAAAGLGIPDPLLDQLAIGGRLVAPVAKSEEEQQLVVVERVSSQRYQRTVLEEVFFVPLQSGTV
ncbi:protein-L-isoaspartate(D-aspartate) O-methyltransferase [Polynucleobacter victoriensis]|uniref:Protein-L-isoaspartate O-methyltransferase n=1 Tax=Polynucleobacter victoriensis TaxID=2049319 RepID=A0A212T1B9_9BURK|nr:protein-L-isoaspartate(D-aspartate) O-methyltransferase [Polynucleobacter victoriensis]SNC59660.1 protein-L-isoaspartate(D-aspartate) O-methyltransferase [Polynucleobacter victoriensis]